MISLSTIPLYLKGFTQPKYDQNILLIVLDSLSAKNMSLYGYSRKTTPCIEKFAKKSTVYHNHYTPGTFTPPGTASLLSGTYPWSHRVVKVMGRMPHDLDKNNLFQLVNQNFYTAAYTQNFQAELLLHQFEDEISNHTPIQKTSKYYQQLSPYMFYNDLPAAYWGERIARGENSTFRGSFYLFGIVDLVQEYFINKIERDKNVAYPQGLPHNYQGMAYLPKDTFNWLEAYAQSLSTPFFGYFHFYPPHHPYRPSKEFIGLFNDDINSVNKPLHIFGEERDDKELLEAYDEFIAETDYYLGKTLSELEKNGFMDNCYVIITSDHGEMFERGIWGHLTPTVYEPLVKIPLIIHKPGQQKRVDVYTNTSSIDILPTLCKITGRGIPTWAEGEILPAFSQFPSNPNRPIFCMDFKNNKPLNKYHSGTISMIKNQYKLIHYYGYEKLNMGFEFYNLRDDPEELDDLYPSNAEIILDMQNELLEKLNKVNRPYNKED